LTAFVLQECGLGSDSYRKAHEIVDHVRKEFEFQGHEMKGPAASLFGAGAGGRHQNNIKRDWFRKMGDMDFDHRAPICWTDVPLWEYGDDGWDQVSKQMPYIIPEEIIPWLMDRNLWPETPTRKITRYWNHLRDVKSELSDVSDGTHHPLWIWADAANYIKDQNILVVCFGSVLDDETNSINKCFPLVLCREEMSCGYETMYAYLEPVVKSFGVLYNNGIQRKNSHQKFCITEIRGDWKMQKEWLNLKNFFQCNLICHECRAHKSTYMRSKMDAQRYTPDEFFTEVLKPGPICPLLLLPHFKIAMVKWCAMHIVHLGCDLWLVGCALKTLLLDTDVWGDSSDDDRLLTAWHEFKHWARQNKWQHSVGKFSTKTITSRQHPYPELQSKAWNARGCVAWMADFFQNLCGDDQSHDLVLVKDCMCSMAEFHQTLEDHGRYLSSEVADLLQHQTESCIAAYIKLAVGALESDRLMWPARPKWHGMQEMD